MTTGGVHDNGVVLRPARLIDAAVFGLFVDRRGGSTPRLGVVDTDDPRSVVEAMWCDAAAVWVAELDARPLAVATVFDLDLLHRTAWIELLTDDELAAEWVDPLTERLVLLALRTWPLRTIRSATPLGSRSLLAAFGERATREGVMPGRCPGTHERDGEIHALWRHDVLGPDARDGADNAC